MKRATFNDAEPIGARAGEPARPLSLCHASPCGWRGTLGEGGRFFCFAHYGKEAVEWSAITSKTADLQWWADFIADVQRMINRPRDGDQPWHAYAAQFWAIADADCAPTAEERRSPTLYVLRMLGELRARVRGKDKPPPHVPQAAWDEFQGDRQSRPTEASGGDVCTRCGQTGHRASRCPWPAEVGKVRPSVAEVSP